MQSVNIQWFFFFIALTLLGLISFGIDLIQSASRNESIPIVETLFKETLFWYANGAISIVIFILTKHLPLSRKSSLKVIAVHLPLSFVLPCLSFVIYLALASLLELWAFGKSTQAIFESFQQQFTGFYLYGAGILTGCLTYWAIVAVGYARNYYARFEAEEIRRTKLESQLVSAELNALKMQLHPHFLFNAFNSVSTLIHANPKAADAMLAKLGDFLRFTLDHSREEKITLNDELRFVQTYLDIEQIRFSDRLTVALNIADETKDALVPSLILQPLVENAVKHGIAKRIASTEIVISSKKVEDKLILTVEDDGFGLQANGNTQHFKIGLSNVSARLAQMYEHRASVGLENRKQSGAIATIKLPFERQMVQNTAPSN